MAPPKLKLIGNDGKEVETNTLPDVGPKTPIDSLPVVLAKGVSVKQSFVEVPLLNTTDASTVSESIKKVLDENPNRRFLKLLNTGFVDIELWTVIPSVDQIGKVVSRGELLKAGQQITEKDTCRTNVIYATSFTDTSGLSVLEG